MSTNSNTMCDSTVLQSTSHTYQLGTQIDLDFSSSIPSLTSVPVMSPNYGNIVFQDTTWPHGSLLNSSIQPNSGKILLKGPNADIDINGTSLTKMLDEIQTRLNILTVRPELEAEWDELKRLGQQYRKLEAEILAKQKTFDLLAKNN